MATSTAITTNLLNSIIRDEFDNCSCQECRGYAWDRVIEIEGR